MLYIISKLAKQFTNNNEIYWCQHIYFVDVITFLMKRIIELKSKIIVMSKLYLSCLYVLMLDHSSICQLFRSCWREPSAYS